MKVFKVIFSIILCLVLWSAGVQAATVTFNPVNSTVSPGSNFSMDIVGQDFPVTDGGGVNLFYDPTVVNILNVTINDTVWDFGFNSLGTINNTLGSLTSLYVNAWSSTPVDFIVATIGFQAVGIGTSNLLLSEWSGNPWASGGSSINPTFVNGSVTVQSTVVPEPASILLIGTGLAGIIGIARKKSRMV